MNSGSDAAINEYVLKARSQWPKTVKSVIFAPAATTFSHAVAKRLNKMFEANIQNLINTMLHISETVFCNSSGPSGFLNQRAVTRSTGRPSQRADFDG